MAANYPNHLEQIEQYQTALKTYQFSKIDTVKYHKKIMSN